MRLALILCSLICLSENASSQCTPPPSDTCSLANIICTLNELDGYSCKNTEKNRTTGCKPLCPSGGSAENTSWWAFISQGGNVCMTITISNCSLTGNGVQFGIWGDCSCSESVFCSSTCSSGSNIILCSDLKACKPYYFFLDGCSGDVCDFTIHALGDTSKILPKLNTLEGSNKVCLGSCKEPYSISLLNNTKGCNPNWEWTLDGVNLNQNNDSIQLDFNQEGNFTLCVVASTGNQNNICDQEGPRCMTVTVSKSKDRTGSPIYVCAENVPYTWLGNTITTSGQYREKLKNQNCCEYDTVVNITILDKPDPPTVYFLGCIGEKYIDPITKQEFNNCQNGTEISLPKSSNPYQCDSSYMLVAAFINGTGRLREYCQGGKLLIEVTPIDRTCADGGYLTESYTYNWYKKLDPTKKSLGSDEFIELDKKDDYCVDITFNGKLDKLTKTCTFTACEQFNEDDFGYEKVCPKGNQVLFIGDTGIYSVDTLFPADARFIWTVAGGKLLTKNPIDAKEIEVLWDFDPSPAKEYTGIVCFYMESSCPPTEECCIDVVIKKKSTSVLDLNNSNELNIVPNPVSQSFSISNANNLKIKSIKLFELSGKEIHEWKTPSKEYSIPNTPSGTYFIKIKTKSGELVKKIVIER